MPMPLGHCGQLASPPRTGPRSRGFGSFGTVIDGLGRTVGFGATVAEGVGASLGARCGVVDAWGVFAAAACFDSGASGASHAVASSSVDSMPATVVPSHGSLPTD